MLSELTVRDLALVEQARVRFQPGLNLLTGETGSGKSLVIDALGLALGARASADQVRHGAARALVEATFTGGQAGSLAREVGGRAQARIDGRTATPARLRELGRGLVAVHGQHEHQALLDAEAQTELLDAFAGATTEREAVAAAHATWTEAARNLAGLERMRDRGDREREYLRWQLDELAAAGLRPGEDEELASERAVARHATKLLELAGGAVEVLRGDEAPGAAAASMQSAAELDERLLPLADRLGTLEDEFADVVAELRRYVESVDADPRRLEEVEDRLALLESIKRKHGGTIEAAIEERDRLASQLAAGEDLGAAIAAAEATVTSARSELERAAAVLGDRRGEAAARLAGGVAGELSGLRLEGSRFDVELRPRPEILPAGAEVAEMLFSANPGEPLAPLARVASGGELARVMLAIKTGTAQADRVPTLVFDEVDAGIGGEAAIQVGLRLKALGATHQVLVVTHLAQVACFADHHLVVEKAPGVDGRNIVRIRELTTDAERAAELARMMGGRVTELALASARELLEEARA